MCTTLGMQQKYYKNMRGYFKYNKLGWAELNQAETVRMQLYAKLFFQVGSSQWLLIYLTFNIWGGASSFHLKRFKYLFWSLKHQFWKLQKKEVAEIFHFW
jgi:hypothetical protein